MKHYLFSVDESEMSALKLGLENLTRATRADAQKAERKNTCDRGGEPIAGALNEEADRCQKLFDRLYWMKPIPESEVEA